MITQYRFALEGDGRPLPAFWAYRLYAWLLGEIPGEVAEALHETGEKPLSQYLGREGGNNIWTLNFLDDTLAEAFRPALAGLEEVPLHTGRLRLHCAGTERLDAQQLLFSVREGEPSRRMTLWFETPTAFKSEGRYAVFPQEKWLIRTLAARWSAAFPALPLDDADALASLERGLRIADYALHTTRYPLKNIKIPAFLGNVTIESRLAAPMEEVWQLLLRFAPYAGVGIKTALGMGAVRVAEDAGRGGGQRPQNG